MTPDFVAGLFFGFTLGFAFTSGLTHRIVFGKWW